MTDEDIDHANTITDSLREALLTHIGGRQLKIGIVQLAIESLVVEFISTTCDLGGPSRKELTENFCAHLILRQDEPPSDTIDLRRQ